MPVVAAAQSAKNAFPDIPFKVFSHFIKENFSPNHSLPSPSCAVYCDQQPRFVELACKTTESRISR
jgi:hypothetical protein